MSEVVIATRTVSKLSIQAANAMVHVSCWSEDDGTLALPPLTPCQAFELSDALRSAATEAASQ